jgi:hypothetical protein
LKKESLKVKEDLRESNKRLEESLKNLTQLYEDKKIIDLDSKKFETESRCLSEVNEKLKDEKQKLEIALNTKIDLLRKESKEEKDRLKEEINLKNSKLTELHNKNLSFEKNEKLLNQKIKELEDQFEFLNKNQRNENNIAYEMEINKLRIEIERHRKDYFESERKRMKMNDNYNEEIKKLSNDKSILEKKLKKGKRRI